MDAEELGGALAASLLAGDVAVGYDAARRRGGRRRPRAAPDAVARRVAGAAQRALGAAVPGADVPRQPAPDAGRPPPRRARACRRRRWSTGTVRILGVVANPPDTPPLDVAAERQRVERAVAEVVAAGRVDARLAGAGHAAPAARGAARRLVPRAALRRSRRLHPGRRGRAVPRGRRRRRGAGAQRARQRRAGQPPRRPGVAAPRRAQRVRRRADVAHRPVRRRGDDARAARRAGGGGDAVRDQRRGGDPVRRGAVHEPHRPAVADRRRRVGGPQGDLHRAGHGRVGDAGAVHGRHRRRAVALDARPGRCRARCRGAARRPRPLRPGRGRGGGRSSASSSGVALLVAAVVVWAAMRPDDEPDAGAADGPAATARRRRRRPPLRPVRAEPPCAAGPPPARRCRRSSPRRSPARSTRPGQVVPTTLDLVAGQLLYVHGTTRVRPAGRLPRAPAGRHAVRRRRRTSARTSGGSTSTESGPWSARRRVLRRRDRALRARARTDPARHDRRARGRTTSDGRDPRPR